MHEIDDSVSKPSGHTKKNDRGKPIEKCSNEGKGARRTLEQKKVQPSETFANW
jgi:hypothetical protein